ncbi:MAG: divalent-cation tolerance protein CutA [Planctomycetota bacterium]|nr:MAG: divalent-cation tolerance protein CutA [Planctomycetota bacterium]
MSTGCVTLYVTSPAGDVPERLARTLVEERLVACVNVLPAGLSHYSWGGEMQVDEEVVLFCKTTEALAERATARLVQLHPYEVPCVLQLPLLGGHAPYLEWLRERVSG